MVQGITDSRLLAVVKLAVGDTDKAPGSRFEARRRARTAAEEAITVLRSEGYYQYVVEPDVGEGEAPQAIVRVTPGPRFLLMEPKLAWVGQPPTPDARIAGESSIGLTIGAPGRAADVVAAEGRVLAAVQKRGYADAVAEPREVVVDHEALSVQPTYRIDPKARVLMDGVELHTDGRTRRAWVRYLAPWRANDVYDPAAVGELERRLLDTGVYGSVNVALAPQANPDGLRPVVVTLTERQRASLDLGASYATGGATAPLGSSYSTAGGTTPFGASYSTAEGAGVDGRYTQYNLLGRADTLKVQGQLAQIQQRLETELSLPHWGRPAQTLRLNAAIYRDDTNAYEETGARVLVDLEKRVGTINYRTIGVSAGVSRDQEPIEVNNVLLRRRRQLFTVALLSGLSIDRSNDPLNPVRGWRLEVRAEPTVHTGDDTLAYLRGWSQASAYVPFDNQANTVVAARLKLGAIAGGRIPQVPGSQRFYSGGGGSIRGFSYQAVGPRYSDNTPQGGLSLVETSLELRRKVIDKWSAVAFIDAGTLGDRAAFDFAKPAVGVGAGVRYDLGFAPIRVDLAIPVNKRAGDAAFQVYLSIGQSF